MTDRRVVWWTCACGREWPFPAGPIGQVAARDFQCATCERAEHAKQVRDLGVRIRQLEATLGLEREGGQGAIAAMHATLDSLGAPMSEWPCIRMSQFVEQIKSEGR